MDKLQYKLNGSWTDIPAGGFKGIGINTRTVEVFEKKGLW